MSEEIEHPKTTDVVTEQDKGRCAPALGSVPINPRCEVWNRNRSECGKPTCYAYPAHGGDWMALCHEHGQKHLPLIKHITELILAGETLAPNAPAH